MRDWKIGDIVNLDEEDDTPPYIGKGTVYIICACGAKLSPNNEPHKKGCRHEPDIYYQNQPEFEGHRTESKFICESCGSETSGPESLFFTGFHDIEKECTTCHNGHTTLRCGFIKEVRTYVPVVILKENGKIFEMWSFRYVATCEDYPSAFLGYVKADNFEEVKKYYNDVVCNGEYNLGIQDHEEN